MDGTRHGSSSGRMRRLMECPVCLNRVTNHRALPCQHIFCEECIAPLALGAHLVCPLCRKNHQLPSGGVHDLPRSVLLMQALEMYCVQCLEREKEVLCAHCDRWLCQTCRGLCEAIQRLTVTTTRILSKRSRCLDSIQRTTDELPAQKAVVTAQISKRADMIVDAVRANQRDAKRDAFFVSRPIFQFGINTIPLSEKSCIGQISILNHEPLHIDTPAVIGRVLPGERFIIPLITVARGWGNMMKTDGDILRQGMNECGKFYYPSSVAVLPGTSTILITDFGNNRIQLLGNNGQCLCQFSDNEAIDGHCIKLRPNSGVTCTNRGLIFVSDSGNNRILELKLLRYEQITVSKVLCHGNACNEKISEPSGLTCDATHLYVCDSGNYRVLALCHDGAFAKNSKMIKTGNLTPRDVAVTPLGNIIVAGHYDDRRTHPLKVYNSQGQVLQVIGIGEPGSIKLLRPGGIALSEDERIIVTDAVSHTVHILDLTGRLLDSLDGDEKLYHPAGVACTPCGKIWVVDQFNHVLRVLRLGDRNW